MLADPVLADPVLADPVLTDPVPAAPPRPAPAHRRARPTVGPAASVRARPDGPGGPGGGLAPRRVLLAGLGFDRLTERQVINHVLGALSRGRGGWIATPNIDICQAAQRDPSLAELVGTASLVVPDGMPLLWAARLRGDQLLERVTGSSLIFTLSAAAARAGRPVYLLGGPPGGPELAADRLRQRYPDLIVAGCYAPPWGFERSREGVLAVRRRLAAARPDIVFVGLGCPKQERLIAAVGPYLPRPGIWAAGRPSRWPPGPFGGRRGGCSKRGWSGCSGSSASRAGCSTGTWWRTCRSRCACWRRAPLSASAAADQRRQLGATPSQAARRSSYGWKYSSSSARSAPGMAAVRGRALCRSNAG